MKDNSGRACIVEASAGPEHPDLKDSLNISRHYAEIGDKVFVIGKLQSRGFDLPLLIADFLYNGTANIALAYVPVPQVKVSEPIER